MNRIPTVHVVDDDDAVRSSLRLLNSKRGVTARQFRSMSGCRKRLNSTSPSAPASTRRRAMFGSELK